MIKMQLWSFSVPKCVFFSGHVVHFARGWSHLVNPICNRGGIKCPHYQESVRHFPMGNVGSPKLLTLFLLVLDTHWALWLWNSQKGPPFGYFWHRLIFFLKNWKFEKQLCWNMSSTERNKVKSFGDPSIDHEEMADQFLVVGALKAPPPVSNRVNS